MKVKGRTAPTGPMFIDPIRELAEARIASGIFRRNKIPIEEKARAVLLYMAGLSSWEIAEE
ncbi:MAG: hypothetical protein ACP5G6_03260, partial [Conexivisphaera sp.]